MNNDNTIKRLEELKQELIERARQVDATINTLKRYPDIVNLKEAKGDVYNEKSNKYRIDEKEPIRKKILMVLKGEGRFLHVREIADIMHKIDPSNSVEQLTKKISPAISSLGKKDLLVKIKIGKSNINSFWGSKSWLDEDGKIKEGHEYNPEFMIKASDEDINL